MSVPGEEAESSCPRSFFSKDGGCPDVFPGVWSLVSLPQVCSHCSVPAGPWPHGLCHALWPLSLLILKPFSGVEENLDVFQCHAGASERSWKPRASASGRLF